MISFPEKLEMFRFYLGLWRGYGVGRNDRYHIEQTYKIGLNSKFLNVYSQSHYLFSNYLGKDGVILNFTGDISYDYARESVIYRQFHPEALFCQYRVEHSSKEHGIIVFLAEYIKNGPKDFRYLNTYQIINENEFMLRLEVAPSEKKDFIFLFQGHLYRQQ